MEHAEIWGLLAGPGQLGNARPWRDHVSKPTSMIFYRMTSKADLWPHRLAYTTDKSMVKHLISVLRENHFSDWLRKELISQLAGRKTIGQDV